LPLSARSIDALARLAVAYDTLLDSQVDSALVDIAYAASVGRAHFDERLAVVADSPSTARKALQAFANGQEHPAVRRGTAVAGRMPEVVFLFTGQGSQYPGMARDLYESAPVFREVIDRCDGLLGADSQGRTLKSVLWALAGDDAPIHETAWTQPALFAVEYGIVQLWRAFGIEPAAVIGHSVGEYVAACIAGVFTLEDGLKLIAERGRLMGSLPPGGTMAALFAPAEEIAAAIAPVADRVAIAAINAPDSVVISGDAQEIDRLLETFAARNVRGHRLFISFAAHSPLVAPALDAMQACAAQVTMRVPRMPIAWNLTGGEPLPGGAPDAVYWRRHLREPVRFAAGMAGLHAQGYRTFLEVGPHPTLIALAQRSLPEGDTLWLNSLRRGKSDWPELLGSLASLYARGAAVNWAEVAKPSVGRPVTLPGYPFERRTFWLSPTTPGQRDASTRRVSGSRDSLQCEPLPAAVPIFESVLTPTTPAYLGEHRVHGAVLVAGPVLLELMQSAAAQAFGSAKRTIGEFTIRDPLVLPEAGRTVQIHFAPSGSGSEEEHAFSIYSRAVDGSGAWRQHATGKLTASADLPLAPPASLDALRAKLGQRTPGDPYYARLADLGIDLGAPFRTLRETYRGTDEALARVELAPSCRAGVVHWTHPTLLDGALQSVGLAVPDTAARDVCLLTGVERVSLRSPLPESLWCHARLRAPAAGQRNEWLADVTLLDDQGAHLGALSGVRLYLASRDALRRAVEGDGGAAERATPDTANLYYEVAWEPVPLAAPAAPLLVSPHTFASQVRERFADLAVEHRLRVYDDLLPALDRLSAEHVVVALLRLGFEARVGRRFTVASEAERLGVLPRHARLFARMLDMLVEDGLLRAATDYSSSALDSMLEVALAFPSPAPEQRYDELLARFGAVDGELLTLRRCAFELAGVLDGTRDPVALLFPGGSLTEARQLYVESPSARTYNGALAAALQAATAALPPNARLRVLEIGAGTGGTTTYLLPLLPADRVEYTFTDVSPLFLERAAEQFSQYPFVRRSLLDIERDPATQGFGAGHYDIVIAANVLHATSDLRRTVEHVRSLIAPGGLLLLLEGTAPERWVDLTFGLTEGWWRFTDRALRPAYPLVACDMWQSLLERLGFEDVAAVPSAEAPTSRATHQALIVARARTHARHWMLLADAGSTACTLADALAHRLRARGDTAIILPARAEPDAIQGNVDVVYLGATDLPVDESDPTDLVEECKVLACAAPLRWLAALGRQPAAGRVWLVTRGAQPIIDDFADAARWQAPLWGLGRVFALEQPSRWGGLIDLPPRGTVEEIAGKLLASLDAPDEEDQTGWRGEQRYAARLIPSPAPKAKPIALRTDAIYLITGGFGGLGLVVARWMVRHGARHLALLARNPDANSPAIRELKALGATIMALRADVADAASMAEAFERIAASGLPLRGVVHAAADFSTAPIDVLEASQVTSMLRPKLDGTVLLERLVASHPLDFLVLFSSSTAVLGATGFAHYAAANQFLDATAQCSRRRERPVLSINWGTWDTMRLASAESQASYRKSGLEPMPSNATLDALGRLLGTKASQAIVASIDWSVLKPLHEARRARPLLAQLGNGSASPIRAAPATVAQDTGVTLLDQLLRAAPVTQHEVLVAIVRQEVAKVLGVDSADDVPLDKGLFEMGMDSLMSVELKRRLERAYGRSLPATLTFNYPNVTALVAFLQRSLTAAGAVTTVSVPPVATMERDPAQAAPGQATPGLDALSEAELEARLLSTLEKMR
jgi:acyl transferase domain-containing protein